MWICLNNGFISAVRDGYDPTKLKVRARVKKHLQDLFPKHTIITTTDSDYRHRVIVERSEFAGFLAQKALAIDYGNFKDSVADDELHRAYVDMWHAGMNMQRRDVEKTIVRPNKRKPKPSKYDPWAGRGGR